MLYVATKYRWIHVLELNLIVPKVTFQSIRLQYVNAEILGEHKVRER